MLCKLLKSTRLLLGGNAIRKKKEAELKKEADKNKADTSRTSPKKEEDEEEKQDDNSPKFLHKRVAPVKERPSGDDLVLVPYHRLTPQQQDQLLLEYGIQPNLISLGARTSAVKEQPLVTNSASHRLLDIDEDVYDDADDEEDKEPIEYLVFLFGYEDGSCRPARRQMAQRLGSSNGNLQTLTNSGDSQMDVQLKTESENPEGGQNDGKVGEYVRELLKEKLSLDPAQWPNAMRLIDQEVKTAQSHGGKLVRENRYVDIYREKPIRVAVKVLVPVKEHPKFNFVGKLLGPKGNSLKRLQEDTMTKMAILGRGSMRDKAKEEEMRQALDPKYAHLSDDLHVEIAALAPPAEAHARIAYALAEIRKYLVPDSNDEIRQEQMREIEAANPPRVPPGGGAPLLRGIGRARGGPPRGPPMGMPPPPTRSLLGAPRPAPPLPPLLPRPQPGKTKVLSILDRARVAMEESYGAYDDPAEMGQAFYDSPAGGFNSGPGYGGDYNGGAGDYYNTSNYTDSASGRWKGYKATGLGAGAGVAGQGGHGGAAARFGGPRPSPYARPPK